MPERLDFTWNETGDKIGGSYNVIGGKSEMKCFDFYFIKIFDLNFSSFNILYVSK